MRALLVLVFALCFAGCGSFAPFPRHHVLMLGGLGTPLDPGRTFVSRDSKLASSLFYLRSLPIADSRARITSLVEALGAFRRGEYEYANTVRAIAGQPPCTPGEKARVAIIMHGGMVTQTQSFEESIEVGNAMLRDCHFPIFVNWRSGFAASYLGHLFATRQGRNVWDGWDDGNDRTEQALGITGGIFLGVGFSPMYLGADLVSGAIMFPHSAYSELQSAWVSFTEQPEFEDPHWRWIRTQRQNLSRDACDAIAASTDPTFTLREGEDHRGWFERSWEAIILPIAMPIKLVLSPFVRGMGSSAWQEMRRRVKLMSHLESHTTPDGLGGDEPSELQALMSVLSGPGGLTALDDVSLIGHSMGAIVATEILRFHEAPHFDNIVFMAAAATIRDYQDSVFPYLKANPDSHMYHLTLHTQAEESEAPAFGLALRGSLLVWIDQFLEKPDTTKDITVGRWLNLLEYAHDTPDDGKHSIRPRIHFKSFDAGWSVDAANPQSHGAMNDLEYEFWEEGYWK